MAKFTEQQLQNLRQARQHLIACKKQLEGANTHLQQFISLVTPFGTNTAAYEKMLGVFTQCEAGLSQAQRSVEQHLPSRDTELKITISDEKPFGDPFWTKTRLLWALIALGSAIVTFYLARYFIRSVFFGGL